ncbi:MAG: FG-GAP-like repeat-containing protein [Thermodesulfobacteriota bacterium]|nr:FG-GAP-like repeat-containing protein [Thermodesulfobacteriota bacterium]
MKFKLILILCLFSFFAFPFHSVAQPKDPGKVYKVAILPFIIHSQENLDYLREGINDILTSRITVEGRIIAIERTVVERILYEMRPMRLDEAVAKQVGTRAGADYVVLGSITKIGNYISLDARLISITEDKPPLGVFTQHKGIDDVMLKIGDFAQDIGYRILGRRATTARPSDPRSSHIIRPEREIGRVGPEGLGFKKSQTFGFEIKGLDIGDVDGDKKNEVVVMDNHNLYIFKYDGDKLSLFRKIEIGYQHNFLTLDVADVNRNGYAEIIVTSVVEDNLQSFIIEYEQGEFRTITRKAGWFFRVLEHPKDGPVLMGQQMGSDGLFTGSIYKFVWKKNSFEKGPKMGLPKDTKIFGLTVADVRNEGKLNTVLLDRRDKISILSPDGKPVWTSRESYGGTANSYDTLKKKPEGFRPQDAPSWRVFIPGRILSRDLDGDGVNEIIINKNYSSLTMFEKAKTYESGEIYNLVWDQDGLMTSWKTKEITGYLSDFQVKDADNDGNEDLVVAVVESHASGSMGGKGTSAILFFKLF